MFYSVPSIVQQKNKISIQVHFQRQVRNIFHYFIYFLDDDLSTHTNFFHAIEDF